MNTRQLLLALQEKIAALETQIAPIAEQELAQRHPVNLANSYQARAIVTRAHDGSEHTRIDYVDNDTSRVTENGGVLEYTFDANWLVTEVRRVIDGKAASLGRREWDRDGMLLADRQRFPSSRQGLCR